MSNTGAGIVAIVGRANVGKSSLFNAIIGRREAITAKEAGTTRDSVTARARWRDKDFWLVDTAGMKQAEDDFELTIQQQISQAAASAQIIIVVTEATTQITNEDRLVANLALKTGQPVILAVNKADENKKIDLESWKSLGIKSIFATSAIHKSGLDGLLDQAVKDLPRKKIAQSSDSIRLAILGRPNVGKSSLFNSLGSKQQAIVAERAGTTRDVNRITIGYHGREIEVLDTAGIRRSGKIERGVEQFSVLRSLAAIEEADICLLVIDTSETGARLDQKIAGLIKEAGRGLILAVNKWDLVEEREEQRNNIIRSIKTDYDFTPWAPLVFTSAITGENVTKIFELVLEIAQARQQKFKTNDLNRWLEKTLAHHPPAGLKGRQPKLNYITQETDQPMPSFKIFGSQVKFLHWSYRRYLERSFRQSWPLMGTPLKFWYIEKKKM